MSKIAVSVIIPVYNVEKYLEQCMKSVQKQSLKNIEIICVDDGSTDYCPQILKEYAKNDRRVKIITQSNGGYGKAMNNGIAEAQGEYIGIVEPDDFVLPNMFKVLYDTAKKYDCEIVKSDFYRFTGNGKTIKKTYCYIAREQKNYNRVISPKEEKECFRFVMNTWCGIYKREFIQKHSINHNETPGASFQDNGFWFKGFCLAERVLFLNKAFYMNRRDNPGSSVANKEKVYCGNTEYNLIYNWLCAKPDMKAEFIDVFMMKELHTYMFNLRRIAPQFRHEYIRKFSEEFAESKAKNELKKAAFTNKEWTELMLLIRDPEEYFYTVEQNRVKVSVVLPVYNCENYLRQCLDSLVAQTLHEIEIICINDGSTDHSGDILTEYAAADGRFVVIHTENKGAGAARNAGLKIACGKYLSFLDSDDWFEPNMLSIAYQKAECDKADITIFRSAQYDNETGTETLCTYSVRLDMLPQYRTFSASDLDCSMFRSIMGWAWDKLYNRSFVLSNDLFFQEQRTTNDMYFTYISLYKASRITVCDQFLYHQRRNVGSSLSSTREQSWQCFYKALCEVRRELKEMGIWARYEPNFVDYSLHSCLWNLNSLSEKQGQELYQKLKQEWFENLGITAAPTKWFAYKDEYKQFCEIMKSDNDYLTFKLSRISFENSEMKKRLAEHAAITEAAVPLDVQEADFWRHEVEAIRNSMSFRIGKKITWVLRKILRK